MVSFDQASALCGDPAPMADASYSFFSNFVDQVVDCNKQHIGI
jgi:hypothetical protein